MRHQAQVVEGISPVDLRPLTPVPATPVEEVRAVVARARAAQPAWEALGLDGRVKLLKAAARRMLERRAEAVKIIGDEVGKPPELAMIAEAIGPLDYFKNWLGVVRPYLKPRKLP